MCGELNNINSGLFFFIDVWYSFSHPQKYCPLLNVIINFISVNQNWKYIDKNLFIIFNIKHDF